jgi:hypothetical protein
MIREERDPAFWDAVARHPEVAPHVFLGTGPIKLAEIVAHPSVLPLASEHGGFIFCRLDSLGRVWELHTLYTPEGWGREVLGALKAAVSRVLTEGQLITTYSVEGWWRSRPPKSFGFQQAGDYRAVPSIGAALSTWVLTKAAWEQSPAHRRG